MSIDEAIDEKAFELVMYITNILSGHAPDDLVQKVVMRVDQFKEKIKELIKDQLLLAKSLEDKVAYLEKSVQDLSNENTQLRQKISELQNENLTLKQENQKLKTELSSLTAEKERIERENDQLVTHLSKLQMENDELREKIFDLQEENRRLQEELDKLQKENEWLKNKVSSAEASWETFEQALIKAANMLKREIHEEIAGIRDMIRQLIYELRTFVNPRGRGKLERINALATTMYNKIIYKDIAGALVRKIRELLQENTPKQ